MNKENAPSSWEAAPASHYESQILLAFMPPSQGQRGLALAIVLLLSIVFVVTMPFIYDPLPKFNAFIPAFETAVFICDLITASMICAAFTASRSRALLVLASGYLFTALIVIPHALSFPDAFAPGGLIGGGPQTTAWLYLVWHFGFPLFIIGYVLLKNVDRRSPKYQGSAVGVIAAFAAVVIALVAGLTWITTAQEAHLPRVVGPDAPFMAVHIAGAGMLLLGALALALLWRGRRSVLDLWLMVVMFAFVFEVARVAFGGSVRFSVGFYSSRIYSLATATIVLLVLLSETTALYANLARSVMRQRGDREARQIAMDVMAASIGHEVNQPLAAMVTNANAALRWLTSATPDLDEARASLRYIVDDGHRASNVIGGVRSMFKKGAHGRLLLDANDAVREVLAMLDLDLRNQRVSVATDLHDGLPQLLADRGQLQQVFLNLIINAIEAMGSITDRARVLWVSSDVIQESSNIVVTIADSGPGIADKDNDRIFEPFFTTKSTGSGIGLAICRSIIEAHGGSLRASANKPHGTIFQVTLPSGDLENRSRA